MDDKSCVSSCKYLNPIYNPVISGSSILAPQHVLINQTLSGITVEYSWLLLLRFPKVRKWPLLWPAPLQGHDPAQGLAGVGGAALSPALCHSLPPERPSSPAHPQNLQSCPQKLGHLCLVLTSITEVSAPGQEARKGANLEPDAFCHHPGPLDPYPQGQPWREMRTFVPVWTRDTNRSFPPQRGLNFSCTRSHEGRLMKPIIFSEK